MEDALHVPPLDGDEVERAETQVGVVVEEDPEGDAGQAAADDPREGDAEDAELRATEEPEERDPVAEDVEHVLADRHQHRVARVAVRAEDAGDGDVHRLHEERAAHEGQEGESVLHEAVRQLHGPEHGVGEEVDGGAERRAEPGVDRDGARGDPVRAGAVAGPEVVRDDDARADADEVEGDQEENDDLVRNPHGRDGPVGDVAHHEGVDGADQQAQRLLDEDRPRQGDEADRGWVLFHRLGRERAGGAAEQAGSGPALPAGSSGGGFRRRSRRNAPT